MKLKSFLAMITTAVALGLGMMASAPATFADGYQRVKTTWQSSPNVFQVKSQYKNRKVYLWNSTHTKKILQLNNYPNTNRIEITLIRTGIMVNCLSTMASMAGLQIINTPKKESFGVVICVPAITQITKCGITYSRATFQIIKNMPNTFRNLLHSISLKWS